MPDMAELASRFAELNKKWLDQKIPPLEQDLHAKENKVRSLGAQITDLWREILTLRREARKLQSLSNNNEAREYELEFTRICGTPGVKSLNIGPGLISVTTDAIYIRHEGKKYEVGDFLLEIYINGFIKIKNVNNRGRYPYYDHPHIRDGEPCLGAHAEAIARLIAEGQFSILVAVLKAYLQNYSPQDAYVEAACWPETVSDAEKR